MFLRNVFLTKKLTHVVHLVHLVKSVVSHWFRNTVGASGNFIRRRFEIVVGFDQIAVVVVLVPGPKSTLFDHLTHFVTIVCTGSSGYTARYRTANNIVPFVPTVRVVAILNFFNIKRGRHFVACWRVRFSVLRPFSDLWPFLYFGSRTSKSLLRTLYFAYFDLFTNLYLLRVEVQL